jgi:hypothetical protein
MSETKKRTKNLTRSRRLRKYEESYEACMDKVNPKSSSRHPKSPKLPKPPKPPSKPSKPSRTPKTIKSSTKESRDPKSNKSSPKASSKASRKACIESNMSRSPYKSPKKKRPLNNYQQFVKDESQKDTYKHLSSSERMTAIGKAWKSLKI